jgi:hypothetical protein
MRSHILFLLNSSLYIRNPPSVVSSAVGWRYSPEAGVDGQPLNLTCATAPSLLKIFWT